MKCEVGEWRNLLCMKVYFYYYIRACIIVSLSWANLCAEENGDSGKTWVQLFNGRDLGGWTPKFVGFDLGVNYRNTFIVRDGLLTVCYDKYKEGWHNNIGHLFYKDEFSHYILRAEYRFLGDQVRDAPESLMSMSSLILHSQSPETVGKDQERPVSVQARLCVGQRKGYNELAQGTNDASATGVDINEQGGDLQQGSQWMSVEIEVHGGEVIRYKSDGQLIAEYKKPVLTDGSTHDSGAIALQASSYPVQFRKIELKVLDQ